MLDALGPLLSRLRAASRRRPARALLFGLALALGGAQLVLQAHSVDHDLLPSSHQVCEHCVIAKHSAPPPAIAAVLPLPALVIVLDAVVDAAPVSRAPLVVRSRAPPALS